MLPGQRAIAAHPDAAVVAVDDVPRVSRIDPERVVIQMHDQRAVVAERLAAVVGDVQVDAVHVDPLRLVGIDADLAEVHRPRIEAVDLGPALALVLGAEDTALAMLDDGVDDVRVLAIDVEADAAGVAGSGRPVGELAPGAAGVHASCRCRSPVRRR